MNPGDTHPMSRLRQWCRRLPASPYFVALGAVLLIAAIWTAALVTIEHERNTAMAAAQKETVNLATAFEEHSIRTIRAVEAVIWRIFEVVERRGLEGAQNEMKALHAANEELLTLISIADAKGDITTSSLETGGVNIAHRVHFRAHAERADAGLVFGVPVEGQRTKQWTMHVARRINQPDGSFGGIVTVGVELDYLTRFYREIDLGADSLITLLGRDGYLRARGDGRGITAAQNLRGTSQIIKRVERGEMRGSLVDVSPVDGIRRIVSFRALPGHPLIVTVGMSEAEVLRHFGAIRGTYVASATALTALVLLLAAALGTLFRHQVRANQQLRASEARFRAFTDLGADWYWESDAQHRLAFASAGVSRWTGTPWTALAGRTLREVGFLPTDTAPLVPRRAIEALEPFRDSQARYVAPGGEVNYFSISGEPIHGADARIAGYRGICRDITNEMRLQQRLRLQNETARLLTSSRPIDEVLTGLLRKICSTFGWVWGVRRVVDKQAGTLTCAESWCVPEIEASEIVQVTRATVYPFRPDGVIALAIETGEPLWRSGLSRFPDSRRADLARKAGIREVVVLPIPHGDSTRYVLQFCSRHTEYPDPVSLETLRAIATEIAQFLTGRAAQAERERLQQQSALLASLVRAANEAATPDEAMETCLARLCEAGNWVLGRAGTYQPGGDLRLPDNSYWYGERLSHYEEFIRASEDIDYLTQPGPFINQVLRERKAIWLEDTWNVPSFDRGPAARSAGLRAAFAIPILVQGEVAGFLELYADAPRAQDAELMTAAETIAAQLARVVERARAQAATAHLAAIVENSNDAIISRTLDRRILTWNAAATLLFGHTADDMVGYNTNILIPPDQEADTARSRSVLQQGKLVPPRDVVRLAKDGRRLDLSVNPSPIKDASGRTIAISLVYRDITERKRAEQELRRRTALAQLLEALARAVNEATTPEAAVHACLERICGYGGWDLGHFALIPGREIGDNRYTSWWYVPHAERYAEVMRHCDDVLVTREHPVGRFAAAALRERKPVWIADLSQIDGMTRLRFAVQAGLRAAFGFPVFVGDEAVAFVEFFAADAREPDEALLAAGGSIAAQLARLIERDRAFRAKAELAAIVETATVAIFTRTLDGTILSWNPGAEKMLGYSAAEVIGKGDAFTLPPDRAPNRARNNESLLRGDVVARESDRIAKDGRLINVLTSHSPLRDGAGSIVGASVILQDISALKQAQATAKESEEQFFKIFRSSPIAISIATAHDGRFIDVNDRFVDFCGYRRDELIGRNGPELGLWVDLEQRSELLKKLFAGEPVRNVEAEFRRKSGEIATALYSREFLRMGDRPVSFTMRVDITERKRAEQELQRKTALAKLLESLARAVSEAVTPDAAVQRCLEQICEHGKWDIGHFAMTSEQDVGDSQHVSFWHEPGDAGRFASFVRRSNDVLGAAGGRGQFAAVAIAERGPIWIADISQVEGLLRLRSAVQAGLRSAFGFPVFVGEEVVAFVEFFAADAREPYEELLAAASSISAQLARLIERDRAFRATARLAAIVENATVAIITRTLDGTILTWNPGAETMLGYAAAEAIGRSIAFTLPPHRPPNLARNNENLLRGEVVARESDRITRDGRVIDVLTSHSPIRDGAGNIVGASIILQDITALKRAQDAVTESEERFRTIFEYAPSGIAQSGLSDYRFTAINPAFAQMLGYAQEEMIGMPAPALTHPSEPVDIKENRERMLQGELDRVAGEHRMLRKDGSMLWVNRTVVPVRTASGDPRHFIGVYEDITERKAAETTLRDYSRRLQVLSRKVLEAQENERASIARELHDQLGQTLSAAKLNLQVFQRRHKDASFAASLKDTVDTVDQALQQVRTLALDLRPPQLDHLGLGTTLHSYAERLAKPARLKLHFSADELPGLPPQIDIACFRVAQGALTNVVRHAQAANVWVTLAVENSMLCLRVRDDGNGCDLRRAQRQAWRGHSMGLLSMEERTLLAGGQFTIRSEPGAGMEVHAQFPIAVEAVATADES